MPTSADPNPTSHMRARTREGVPLRVVPGRHWSALQAGRQSGATALVWPGARYFQTARFPNAVHGQRAGYPVDLPFAHSGKQQWMPIDNLLKCLALHDRYSLRVQQMSNKHCESMGTTKHITPNSGPTALAKLDQRTKAARLVREIRAALIKHVGGNPNEVQLALIEQATQIKLRLALMDKKFVAVDQMDDGSTRRYLAWSGHYARLLRQLGPAVAEKPPSLQDLIANWQSPAAATARAEPSQAAQTPGVASRSTAPVDAAA